MGGSANTACLKRGAGERGELKSAFVSCCSCAYRFKPRRKTTLATRVEAYRAAHSIRKAAVLANKN